MEFHKTISSNFSIGYFPSILLRAGHDGRLEVICGTNKPLVLLVCVLQIRAHFSFNIPINLLEHHWSNCRKLVFLKSSPATSKITSLLYN